MADGVPSESIKPNPESSKQTSRSEKFVEWLKGFGKSKKTNAEPSIEPVIPKTAEPPKSPEPIKKQIDLQVLLDAKLKERGIQPPAFKSEGVSDFHNSNETFDPVGFENLLRMYREQRPDGYIIGVGTTSILTGLELFSKENPPKGMVLINVDPKTVVEGKMFVDALKRGKHLYSDYKGLLQETELSSKFALDYKELMKKQDLSSVATGMVIPHQTEVLRDLASSGRIAVLQQDIFDPRVLEVLKDSLEGLNESNNVVYLSNVGDWIMRLRPKSIDQAFAPYQNLQAIVPQKPHINYFIDSSQNAKGVYKPYQQRVSIAIPTAERYS